MAVTVVRFINSLESADLSKAVAGTIYVLPGGEMFEYRATNELGGIGSFFKNLGIVAANAFVPGAGTLIAGLTQGSPSNAAAANQFAQQVLQQVAQIRDQAAQLPAGEIRFSARDQLRAAATQLIDSLQTAMSQLSKESDRNILRTAQQQAWQIVGEMNRLIDTPGPTPESNDMIFDTPGAAGTTSGATSGGIDTNTLLIIAVVIGGFWLLK